MGGSDIARQVARWTALSALFLIPVTPLIVTNGFFFPFITGKAFYFRILVEVAVVAWLALAALDRAYRPRFSIIGVAALAFLVWMAVADASAVNVHKAFWSNFERMEGWVFLVHLYGFFLAASAVLRVERKWRAWFLTALGVAVVVCLYAFFQLIDPTDFPIHQGSTRIDASLGNSAYFAIYLLFNLFIALWMALTEKSKGLKWSLIAFAACEGILIFFTETRGTVLGLAGGLVLAAVLTALTAGGRARRYALGGLALILVLAGSFYLARNSPIVRSSHTLDRIATISPADLKVRFMIWHMAWQGFLERPVTGWGQEGFSFVFDRHYDPRLYGQEPWFDRAHNAFLDWLIAGGAPGLVLFLALFGSTVWLLWRRSELSRPERIALTAALAGYAIHNLAVFDNLSSYIYFFAILALVDSQVARPIRAFEALPALDAAGGVTYALPIATVALAGMIWYINIPGMMVATDLITALSPSSAGPATNIAAFTDLAAHPAFAAQEVREQMVSYASALVGDQKATTQQKQQMLTLAVENMQKQVAAYPSDTREYMELVYVYEAGGDEKDALAAVLRAGELTPTKEDIWITAGMIAWNMGDYNAAKGFFDKASSLDPGSADLALYSAAGAYALGQNAQGDALLFKSYGTTTIDSQALSAAFYHAKSWGRLVAIWELRASKSDASATTLFSLAAAYYVDGRPAAAIATIQDAVKRYPEAAASGAAAIKQIKAGAPIQ